LGHGEEGTFEKYLTQSGLKINEHLVKRFADLLELAGDNRTVTVVLSSIWRNPEHAELAAQLEQELSRCLGKPFAFHARTALGDDRDPAERLKKIGDYVAAHSRASQQPSQNLLVLVLDDFHVTPLEGWSCDGDDMCSEEAVETYVKHRALRPEDVSVKLIHTYDEWATVKGLRVQVSTGLTMKHFCQASTFLGRPCEFCLRSWHLPDSCCAGVAQLISATRGQNAKKQNAARTSKSEVRHYWGLLQDLKHLVHFKPPVYQQRA